MNIEDELRRRIATAFGVSDKYWATTVTEKPDRALTLEDIQHALTLIPKSPPNRTYWMNIDDIVPLSRELRKLNMRLERVKGRSIFNLYPRSERGYLYTIATIYVDTFRKLPRGKIVLWDTKGVR